MLTILKLLKSDREMLNYPFRMASLQGGIRKKKAERTLEPQSWKTTK